MLAEARRDGQRLRGVGDAQSIHIYAEAFDKDKPFFAFYRSMQAYRDAFGGTGTSFVLSPTGDFFRFFGGGQSLAGTTPATATTAPAAPKAAPAVPAKPAPPAAAPANPPAK
jgi:membrane protease subunit HflC